jgi:UDP-sulfoquinovose synthase
MGITMRVLVLGGDGFCGWPTSLYLSARGHEVTIVDNRSRRKIDTDLEVGSLTPIAAAGDRRRAGMTTADDLVLAQPHG